MSIPVVYEDSWLLVVNKPSGLLTIPAPKNERRTLTGILNEDFKKNGNLYRLHSCHRLDRETSGLVIYAKGKAVQKKMMELFKRKEIKKTYVAFVHGNLTKGQGEIKSALEGRSAFTGYKVLERRKDFNIVQVEPLTGRKNQIRIHFKGIGHPLVGETKFAFRRDFPLRAKRLCLHAQTLEFRHPVTGENIHIEAGLPSDLKTFLDKNPE
jgi:RluA family pseudouridine synthase